MDGVFARLYRRTGIWYAALLVFLAAFLAFFFTTVVLYIAIVQYIGVPVRRFIGPDAVGVTGVAIGTLIADVLIFRASRPTFRWMRGDKSPENAVAAWESTARMPSLHFTRAPIPIGIGALPAVWALNIVANPTWYTNGAFVVASLFVVALAISIHMVGTGAILRPVIAEIDHMYPHSVADARLATNSLRPRIVGSSVLVVWISAWLASGLVTRTAEPLPRLALTFAAGGVVALTFGSILMLALSQSIFAPLRALTNATRRVRAGDLATRLSLVSNDELGELARSFNAMVNGLAEREALRSALGTYVEPGIAERLLSEGEILQGEEVDVTIMFVDIVGFSARAEMMPADQICAELNDFFGLIVPIVAEHDGHTNKLIGDGLMAVFGTPIHLDDHADRALRSACAIQDALWERYRGALRAGIGLNTGSVVVGTMGGGTKLDFTLIGDAVNVAARVEALTRGTDDAILLTEATRQAVREPRVALASRGVTPVKGRAEPVSVYSARSWVPA